jgi:hypothetical protein
MLVDRINHEIASLQPSFRKAVFYKLCNLPGCSLVWITVNRTPPPPPPGSREAAQASDRADLIKRLFAVAISVGAATTLYQMSWVRVGRPPCIAEYQQLLILVAAMTATVLSWDGYLWSIAQRPLRSFWRFAIDILLVFIYLFLLMTSQLVTWWLFIHALIYTLYALWDFLTIADWIVAYYPSDRQADTLTIRGVYNEGLSDGAPESRGPIITIAWGLYFWLLCGLNYLFLPLFSGRGLRDHIVGTAVLVVLGLYLYRQDKLYRHSMRTRWAWIVILFLADAAYLGWLPTDQTIWNWVGPHIGTATCPQQ